MSGAFVDVREFDYNSAAGAASLDYAHLEVPDQVVCHHHLLREAAPAGELTRARNLKSLQCLAALVAKYWKKTQHTKKNETQISLSHACVLTRQQQLFVATKKKKKNSSNSNDDDDDKTENTTF